MPPGSVRFGQLAVAPAHQKKSMGLAWPKGCSKLWPSPVPKPSRETPKFWTRRSWLTMRPPPGRSRAGRTPPGIRRSRPSPTRPARRPGSARAGRARCAGRRRSSCRSPRRRRCTKWVRRSVQPVSVGSSSQRMREPGSTWVCSRSIGASTRRMVQVIVGASSPRPTKRISPPSRRSTVMSASNGSHQSARRSGSVMADHTSRMG